MLDLIDAGRIPVVVHASRPTPTAWCYNVNADTAAAALAVALGAEKLVVLTDVEGLYADWPDRDSLRQRARRGRRSSELLPEAGGRHGARRWRPACAPSRGGVPQAHVIDGRVRTRVLLEVFTDEGIGTMVVPDRDRAAAA